MGKKSTLATAKATCAAYGMSLKKRDGELVVNFRKGSEATAYYTNSLHDAVGTCRDMAVRAAAGRGGGRTFGSFRGCIRSARRSGRVSGKTVKRCRVQAGRR